MRSSTKVLGLPLLCFALALVPSWAMSQEAAKAFYQEAREHFAQIDQFEVDGISKRPVLIKGRLSDRIDVSDEAQIKGYLRGIGSVFGLEPSRDDFRIRKTIANEVGLHTRVQHLHRGVPVFGAEIILHDDGAGRVGMINGKIVDNLDVDTALVLSGEQAMEIALQHIGPAKYRWEYPAHEAIIKEVYGDSKRTWRPTPELAIAPYRGEIDGADYRLVWKIMIPVEEPAPANWLYFVDAKTGEIINHFNNIHSGSGPTLYSGNVTFSTNLVGASFQLHNVARNVKTYTANNGVSLPGTIGTDSDDVWPLNALNDTHWGTERTHEYYQTVHGRSSYSGTGLQMTATAHYSVNYVNAFWNGVQTVYGDGDGVTSSHLTTLDIIGHEFTHGVTDFESALIYQGESGALNESMSDIFGETIEKFFKDDGLWLVGEECWTPAIAGDALRFMANPNAASDPDTYGGTFWVSPSSPSDNGGVHTNSGVSNFCYYLLTQGGSGTNDFGVAYNVTGIGIANARAIWYLAQTTYLTPSSTFAAARTATENAAIALFGSGSTQHVQLQNAWCAVGVGAGCGVAVCNNIALNKPATASSTNGANVPGRAVDASTTTFWRSASGGTQWLQVDLGTGTLNYTSGELLWNGSRYAKSYSIRVSNNPSFPTGSYTTVFSTTTGNGGTDTFSFASRSERYIRINMTVAKSGHYRIANFKVCGSSTVGAGSGSLTENDENQFGAAALPEEITLSSNYPNPFNPSTNISFGLPEETHVSLKVYNLLGQEVATLVDERRIAGFHTVTFQPADLSSGVYFYVLRAGETRLTRRLVFMK